MVFAKKKEYRDMNWYKKAQLNKYGYIRQQDISPEEYNYGKYLLDKNTKNNLIKFEKLRKIDVHKNEIKKLEQLLQKLPLAESEAKEIRLQIGQHKAAISNIFNKI